MRDLVLAIETSHDRGGVALVGGSDSPVERRSTDRLKHSEELLVLVDALLRESGVSLGDIGGIAVSIGPGSFTGLRVGLAAGKGLSVSRGIALVSVGTLDGLAEMCSGKEPHVLAVIDAKRGEVYWSEYEWVGGAYRRMTDYGAISPAGLVKLVSRETLIVGSGVEPYRDYILKNASGKVRLQDPNPQCPSPGVIGAMGLKKLRKGLVEDIEALEPIYIRPSDAEAAKKNERR